MAQELLECVDHIGRCYLGDRHDTEDRAIVPLDRPAGRDRGALTCVAMHDPSGRRGLWFRTDREDDGEGGLETVVRLYAGREGDDVSVILRGLDSNVMLALNLVLSYARDAYAESVFGDEFGDWSAVQSWFAPNEGGYCGRAVERCGATDDWAELYEMGAR